MSKKIAGPILLIFCCNLLCLDTFGQNFSKTILVDKNFLAIPLTENDSLGEYKTRLTLEGTNFIYEPMNFAEEGDAWWVNLDVSQHKGKTMALHNVPSSVLEKIVQSDTIVGHPNLYNEENRPQFHFSYRHGVLGDPTAKFYYAPNDEWHMFFIYNPFRGKEVSWGHAVSKDLVHWEERPQIYEYGSRLFNGTGFVDKKNHLGLNVNGHQAIVLLQTFVDQKGGTFSYVISVDGGKTFKTVNALKTELNRPDLPSNPLAEGWHDAPRIYWSDTYNRYVLYLKRDYQVVHQYYSDDLKSWEQVEDVPAIPESFTFEGDPGELVDMYLDGDKEKKYTVSMYGLHGYIVGQYGADGMLNLKGEPIDKDDMVLTAHFGYPTIFHNPKNGRIMMNQNLGNNGKGGIPNYEIDHRPDASFPVELTLKTTEEGPRLFFNPIEEIETLHGERYRFKSKSLNDAVFPLEGLEGRTFRIRATFKPQDAEQFGLNIFGSEVVYDTRYKMLAVDTDPKSEETDRKRRKLNLNDDGTISLDILVDLTSLEIFANQGTVHIPHGKQEYYKQEEGDISVFAKGGKVKVTDLEIYELNSIWPSVKTK